MALLKQSCPPADFQPTPDATEAGFPETWEDWRIFDVATARYIEPDPIGVSGTTIGNMNPYGYASQNPVKFYDPWGLLDLDFTDRNDPSYNSGQAYDNPNYFTFSGHGSNQDTNHIFSTGDGKGKSFDVATVGNDIIAAGWNNKKPIQAMICYGNMGGNNNSFDAKLAQYLANITRSDVTIYGSTDVVHPERWQITGTSFYFGGADPGPSGWVPITKSPNSE